MAKVKLVAEVEATTKREGDSYLAGLGMKVSGDEPTPTLRDV